jgi:hypothetical protein
VSCHHVAVLPDETRIWLGFREGNCDPSQKIYFTIFLQELQRLGFVEGQNLTVERYSAESDRERFGYRRNKRPTCCAERGPAGCLIYSRQSTSC